jgi:hypothetical protein
VSCDPGRRGEFPQDRFIAPAANRGWIPCGEFPAAGAEGGEEHVQVREQNLGQDHFLSFLSIRYRKKRPIHSKICIFPEVEIKYTWF